MRDPEMYNYVRQVLDTMKQDNVDLGHALAMHGDNMTEDEVREIVAERPALQRLSGSMAGAKDRQVPGDRWAL